MEEKPTTPINPEEAHRLKILAKINAALKSLESSATYRRAYEALPEYKPLENMNIAMVDDSANIGEAFIPHFMIATNGNMSFILHKDQSLATFVKKILEVKPDIVLIDYTLENGIKGDDLARLLLYEGFSGKIVGFSSSAFYNKKFTDIGALAVKKDTSEPINSVIALANLIK